jgi:hypothetical protein
MGATSLLCTNFFDLIKKWRFLLTLFIRIWYSLNEELQGVVVTVNPFGKTRALLIGRDNAATAGFG